MEKVNHPEYYGGEENPYEVIKIIEALDLNFHLGNVLKYIVRAGKKGSTTELEDLKKAQWYIERRIDIIENYICKEEGKYDTTLACTFCKFENVNPGNTPCNDCINYDKFQM